jgi:hypothetical protein
VKTCITGCLSALVGQKNRAPRSGDFLPSFRLMNCILVIDKGTMGKEQLEEEHQLRVAGFTLPSRGPAPCRIYS